jgi:two-component system LytT family response regulator
MGNKFKIVIVDNNKDAIDNLKTALTGYNDFEVVNTAHNGASAKKSIFKERPDVLFLDVELPDISGLELLKLIRDAVDWNLHVVFYSAYDKYLLEALRESAFDFLLKPIDEKDFESIMSKLNIELRKEKDNHVSSRFKVRTNSLFPTKDNTFLITTITNEVRVLHIENIGYFRYNSFKRQWEVVLTDMSSIPLKRNTSAEDIVKQSPFFIRTHQSYIINMDYLELISDTSCTLFPPFDKVEEIKISAHYRRKLCEGFNCL